MITNANESASTSQSDIKRYIGVATVNVVAVNPNNETLKKYGWNIAEGAEEPSYGTSKNSDGTERAARVRLLVSIKELPGNPVIPLDFSVRPEIRANADKTKFQIIDAYGRTAWATEEEIKNRKVPVYSNGSVAQISTPYRLCHAGEETLIKFLSKYLNVTPFDIFDKAKGQYVPSKNPGKVSIDDWDALCKGDAKELKGYFAMKPDNVVKVILGVRTSDDNRTYQTFFRDGFLSNGNYVSIVTGVYDNAKKLLDKYYERRGDSGDRFDAKAVHFAEAPKPTADTDIKDNSDAVPPTAADTVPPVDAGLFSSAVSDDADDLPFD